MGRRNESPEKKKRRALIAELMIETPIKDGNDVNALMRELLSEVLENALEGELDDELGYTRYDYRNKETDNSRNGEFEPKVVRKHQNTLTQDIEAKILSMYAKGMSTGDIEHHTGTKGTG